MGDYKIVMIIIDKNLGSYITWQSYSLMYIINGVKLQEMFFWATSI